jgi:hypothetical protein
MGFRTKITLESVLARRMQWKSTRMTDRQSSAGCVHPKSTFQEASYAMAIAVGMTPEQVQPNRR